MALRAEVLHAYKSAMLSSFICVALLEVLSFLIPVVCSQGKSSISFIFTTHRDGSILGKLILELPGKDLKYLCSCQFKFNLSPDLLLRK